MILPCCSRSGQAKIETIGTSTPLVRLSYTLQKEWGLEFEFIKDGSSLDCFLVRKNGYFSSILKDNRILPIRFHQEEKHMVIEGIKMVGRQRIKIDQKSIEDVLSEFSARKKVEMIVENCKTTIEFEDFLKQYNKLKELKGARFYEQT